MWRMIRVQLLSHAKSRSLQQMLNKCWSLIKIQRLSPPVSFMLCSIEITFFRTGADWPTASSRNQRRHAMPNFILAPHHAAGNGRRAVSGFRNPGISLYLNGCSQSFRRCSMLHGVSKYQCGSPQIRNLAPQNPSKSHSFESSKPHLPCRLRRHVSKMLG